MSDLTHSSKQDCSALVKNARCCINGFPVTGACFGKINNGEPMCLNEEWSGRVFNNNGGKPKQNECS